MTQQLTPAPLCDAIVKASIDAELKENDQVIGRLRRQGKRPNDPAMQNAQAQRRMIAAQRVEDVDFKEVSHMVPARELANILRAHGLNATPRSAAEIVMHLPRCDRKVSVRDGVEAIKEKLSQQQVSPACGVTDDRLSAFDAPSAAAFAALEACAQR